MILQLTLSPLANDLETSIRMLLNSFEKCIYYLSRLICDKISFINILRLYRRVLSPLNSHFFISPSVRETESFHYYFKLRSPYFFARSSFSSFPLFFHFPRNYGADRSPTITFSLDHNSWSYHFFPDVFPLILFVRYSSYIYISNAFRMLLHYSYSLWIFFVRNCLFSVALRSIRFHVESQSLTLRNIETNKIYEFVIFVVHWSFDWRRQV